MNFSGCLRPSVAFRQQIQNLKGQKKLEPNLLTRIFIFKYTRIITTKLTSSIDDAVISDAKKDTQSKGKSLSGIVENYLMTLSTTEGRVEKISPGVLKLMGVIELPKDFDTKGRGQIASLKSTRHEAVLFGYQCIDQFSGG